MMPGLGNRPCKAMPLAKKLGLPLRETKKLYNFAGEKKDKEMETVTIQFDRHNLSARNLLNYIRTLDFVHVCDDKEAILEDMRQSKREAEALANSPRQGHTIDEILSMI